MFHLLVENIRIFTRTWHSFCAKTLNTLDEIYLVFTSRSKHPPFIFNNCISLFVDCFIPRGALYDRASFRLQYGNDIGQLARGQLVRQYMRVVIVCNLEMLSDMILDYHIVTCHRGRWKPRMPRCEGT